MIIVPASSSLTEEKLQEGIRKAVGDDLKVVEMCIVGIVTPSKLNALVEEIKAHHETCDVIIIHSQSEKFYNDMGKIAHMGSGSIGIDIPIHHDTSPIIVEHVDRPMKRKGILIAAAGLLMMDNMKVFEPPAMKITMRPDMLPDRLMIPEAKKNPKKKTDPFDFGRNKFNKKTGHRPRY